MATRIKKGVKLSPMTLLMAAGLTAIAFGIYLYFSHAATASCASGIVQMSAGDSCSVQAAGQYEFGYRSTGPSSHAITYNGRAVSTSNDPSPTSGCWKGGSDLAAGNYTFTVNSGTMLVHGGSCDTNLSPAGALSCARLSHSSIKWSMSWQNAKNRNIVLMRSGTVIDFVSQAATGSATDTELGLRSGKYSAILRDGKAGTILASASCQI